MSRKKINKFPGQTEEEWYLPQNIALRLDKNVRFDTQTHKEFFFNAISKLPTDIIDFAEDNIFFVSPDKNKDKAETILFDKEDPYFSAIVHFYPPLWESEDLDIENSIAHEIAHVKLKHTFGDSSPYNETAASKLASKWLGREIISDTEKNLLELQNLKDK